MTLGFEGGKELGTLMVGKVERCDVFFSVEYDTGHLSVADISRLIVL